MPPVTSQILRFLTQFVGVIAGGKTHLVLVVDPHNPAGLAETCARPQVRACYEARTYDFTIIIFVAVFLSAYGQSPGGPQGRVWLISQLCFSVSHPLCNTTTALPQTATTPPPPHPTCLAHSSCPPRLLVTFPCRAQTPASPVPPMPQRVALAGVPSPPQPVLARAILSTISTHADFWSLSVFLSLSFSLFLSVSVSFFPSLCFEGRA